MRTGGPGPGPHLRRRARVSTPPTATPAGCATSFEDARRLGHEHLGTEHILLALAQRRELLPEDVAELLPGPDAVRAALAVRADEPPRRESDLLKTVGVDLDQVRTTVRRTFGADAVERLGRRRVRQPWQPWRRPARRCTSLLAGTPTAAPRLKEAFERARQHAEPRHATLDPAILLLAMLTVERAWSNEILRRTGVDPETLITLLGRAGA